MGKIDQKIQFWRNRLLDLGRRNRLINCPKRGEGTASRTAIEFLEPNITFYWETFGEGKQKGIQIPINMERVYESSGDLKTGFTFKNGVRTNQSEKDTIITIRNLKSKARSFIEEKGFNALYMAFGFLKWKEASFNGKEMRSPLVLVPIEIRQENFFTPIFIFRHDDEIVSNKALAQKFQNDFKITLPEFNNDIHTTLDGYFEEVKKACESINTEIETAVELSLFSFLKIDMYQDFGQNYDAIAEHPIVNVIAGTARLRDNTKDVSDFDYDSTPPQEILNVVDADSSQQEAVNLAKAGASFILQGPPGTGKSQTITNIIAELMAQGKSVLFVSEKMAALDVVYKRLSAVGLKDFCFTLHSTNAKRREIINQLEASLKLAEKKYEVTEQAKQKLEKLVAARNELNAYLRELHTPIEPLNVTVYKVNGILATIWDSPDVRFSYKGASHIDENTFDRMITALQSLVKIIEERGWQTKSPWNECKLKDVSYDFKFDFSISCPELIQKIQKGLVVIGKFNEIIQSSATFDTNALDGIILFINTATDDTEVPKSYFKKGIIDAKNCFDDWEQKSNTVSKYFNDTVYALEADNLLSELKTKYKFFLVRLFSKNYKNLIKQIAEHTKSGKKPFYKKAKKRLEEVIASKTARANLDSAIARISEDGSEAPDKFELKRRINKAFTIFDFSAKYGVHEDVYLKLAERDEELLKSLKDIGLELLEWQEQFIPALREFAGLFLRPELIFATEMNALYERVQGCHENYAGLEAYIDYRAVLEKWKARGIDLFLEQAEAQGLKPDEIVPAFKKIFFREWLDEVIGNFEHLKSFRRLKHEALIKEFKMLDLLHLEIARAMVIAKLTERLPDLNSFTADADELGMLKREIAKQRKLLPPRKLIALIPNLLPALKPCMMMSPLTVSTFLSGTRRFDTVIFDEASQIRSEDAIGAIFRANQAIIAGDSKQLPPTDFFMASAEREEDEISDDYDDLGAYESLLDEALLLPSRTLRWHYRSKHEHLIAFSNIKIYGGSLVTFPSSLEKGPDIGVQYVYVEDGTYDRGGGRGNRKEAERVADLVFEHFTKNPDRSLGVIAFGEVQQEAISNAIDRRRKNNRQFEEFFRDDLPEPFFIKNLETVQGDERDFIIFSIGYAKDDTGKFTMNFGPLSRAGGERRLNVAITRARYNVKLVGSILPTDINAERVSGEGPKLLRLYIDYAISGIAALTDDEKAKEEKKESTTAAFNAEFEKAVYNYLVDCGYDVATCVGCSDYRLDMAVRHPDDNGKFVMGIECDGPSYLSARTARERDRLRQSVLESMGWNIYRVWSVDWIKDPASEKKRLKEAVDKAISRQSDAVKPEPPKPNSHMSYLQSTTKPRNQLPLPAHKGMPADQVPPREFMRIMCAVLEKSYGITKEGLFRTVCAIYGWQRIGSVINACLNHALGQLCKDKIVAVLEEDKVELQNKYWREVI